MKRDMDLIRQILFKIEEANTVTDGIEMSFQGHSDDEIAYHLKILRQAGLIDAVDVSAGGHLAYIPTSLTWAGQEFLEAARDDTKWNKAKSIIVQKGGEMTFEFLKMTLVELGKQALGLGGSPIPPH